MELHRITCTTRNVGYVSCDTSNFAFFRVNLRKFMCDSIQLIYLSFESTFESNNFNKSRAKYFKFNLISSTHQSERGMKCHFERKRNC